MRLGVVLLGAKCSGKTSLARAALHCHSPELDIDAAPTPKKPFVEHAARGNISVLDAHAATTRKQKLWLGQELARRMIRVALVTVPRNAPNTTKALFWCDFAREHCPDAYVGIVVTKNDLAAVPTAGETFLQEHAFENSVYDLMQCAGGADHLFYTSARNSRGTDDLRRWVMDMCTGEDPLDGFGEANTSPAGRKKTRRKKKHRDEACTMEGCETCCVQ